MDKLQFVCDGRETDVPIAEGETLLNVLRERLRIRSVKDGCAPQGQCGCCTVLVDGKPRVACVTPATRVDGREVTTPDGLDPLLSAVLADALLGSGGAQCGFCTPGIMVRCAGLIGSDVDQQGLDRALGAHLCRCTGWQTISEAVQGRAGEVDVPAAATRTGRDLVAAGRRAELEGGEPQLVSREVPIGRGGFADDDSPPGALVAVPRPVGSSAAAVTAAGIDWVIGESVREAREAAAKVQGRRSSASAEPAPRA